MSYQTTITRKGQLTLPKRVRELLHLALGSRVSLEPERSGSKLKITALPSLDKIAGSFRVQKPLNPVSIRAQMERSYRKK